MGGAMNNTWSKVDREKCFQLARDGLSGSEIGRILNRPRNSIIGALHRAGIPLTGHLREKPERVARTPPKPRIRVKSKPVISKPKPPQPLKPEPPIPDVKAKQRGEYGPTSFTDTRLDQCMWVTHASRDNNRAIVCGEAVKKIGCRWCSEHYAIVYLPPLERKKTIKSMDYTNWTLGKK